MSKPERAVKPEQPINIPSKHEKQLAREYAFDKLRNGELSFTIAKYLMVTYNTNWMVAIDLVRQVQKAKDKLENGNGQGTRANNQD